MKRHIFALVAAASISSPAPLSAETLADNSADFGAFDMFLVGKQGPGKYIGTVELRATEHGVVFHPELNELPPGLHGFHVHEKPDCGPNTKDAEHNVVPAGAAGEHFDPNSTGEHGGPWDIGHRGDLPNLYVNEKGVASHPVLAPRLKMDYLDGRSLVIHANADNYSEKPVNGGSGPRIACGTFSAKAMDD